MFFTIKNLLPRREVQTLVDMSKKLTFVDGRASSNPGSIVKNNLQGDIKDPIYMECGKIVQRALFTNPVFKEYAFPKNVAMPMICRYEPGMEYGFHVDAAILATKPPMRADVSTTVFLNDPASYEGGELVARMGDREVDVKLEPGDAVVYPSITLHKVRPVTKGQRLVSITFTESQVPNHYHRQLLFELGRAIDREAKKLSWETMTELTNVHTNLKRMWIGK